MIFDFSSLRFPRASVSRLVPLVIGLGLWLPACSKTGEHATADSGAAATPDQLSATRSACDLLTAEDARTALGVDVNQTDAANASGSPVCQYMASSSESVTLQIQPGAPSDFDNYVKQSEDAFGVKAEPVAGIGERAAQVGDQFIFIKSNQMYIVTIGKNLPPAEKADRTRKLARAILSRA